MSGVISRGVRAPIIREGDDIVKLTADAVEAAMAEEGFELHERDIVAVTESVVARSDGNYASVDHIAQDVRTKLGGETVGVVFPILSRNRFAICLRGIARGAKKIVLMLSYPSDEVGNHLVSLDKLADTSADSPLCFRPLEPRLESGLDIVWKKYQVFSPAAEAFLDRLRERCAESLDC